MRNTQMKLIFIPMVVFAATTGSSNSISLAVRKTTPPRAFLLQKQLRLPPPRSVPRIPIGELISPSNAMQYAVD